MELMDTTVLLSESKETNTCPFSNIPLATCQNSKEENKLNLMKNDDDDDGST